MEAYLKNLGLEKYWPKFNTEGVDMATASSISEAEMQQDLGMSAADAKKLHEALHSAQPAASTSTAAPGSIEALLQSLGLQQYIAKFQAEQVDISVARTLNEEELKGLGLTMGARRKLMDALRSGSTAPAASAAAPAAPAHTTTAPAAAPAPAAPAPAAPAPAAPSPAAKPAPGLKPVAKSSAPKLFVLNRQKHPWAVFHSDGTIVVNDAVAGSFDSNTGVLVDATGAVLGSAKALSETASDLFSRADQCVGSYVCNVHGKKPHLKYDGATIRPSGNPFNNDINQNGHILQYGTAWGELSPVKHGHIEHYFLAATMICVFFADGFVLESCQTQTVLKALPSSGAPPAASSSHNTKTLADKGKGLLGKLSSGGGLHLGF